MNSLHDNTLKTRTATLNQYTVLYLSGSETVHVMAIISPDIESGVKRFNELHKNRTIQGIFKSNVIPTKPC